MILLLEYDDAILELYVNLNFFGLPTRFYLERVQTFSVVHDELAGTWLTSSELNRIVQAHIAQAGPEFR